MTTMRDDLDVMLAAWFEREATADGAAAILEIALERTSRRRPRPAWVARIRSSSAGPWLALDPTARTRLGYALILAALLAAVVVGALFLAGRQPPPAPTLGCVGDPPNLCGFGEGTWSSSTFLPGLRVTLPGSNWYTRDVPDRLEFRHQPMTSALTIQLDPIPADGAATSEAARMGTLDGLSDFLARQSVVTVDSSRPDTTAAGLPVRAFDLKTMARPSVGLLRLRSAGANVFAAEADHYAQRLYLVGIGDGHVLSALVVAFDSQQPTLEAFDDTVWPIIDSLRPPAASRP